jgi:hypothetical protein
VSTQTDQPAWRVLLGYVAPFRAALVLGGVLSLATAATGLALPLVVRELIDGLGADRGIVGLLVLMSVLVLANAGIGALGSFLLERTAESVVLVARRRLVSRLLWHPGAGRHRAGRSDVAGQRGHHPAARGEHPSSGVRGDLHAHPARHDHDDGPAGPGATRGHPGRTRSGPGRDRRGSAANLPGRQAGPRGGRHDERRT